MPPEATTGRVVRAVTARRRFEVRALQGAVLRDVGDDVAAAAGVLEALEHVPQVAALARPAARGERRAANVESDRDRLAVPPDHVGGPLGVLERGGAEVDARRAGFERGLEGGVVADAAGQLHLHAAQLLDDTADDGGVVASAERGVEVDEVDPLRAVACPGGGRVDGVAVARLGAGLALREADGLAAGDIHGRQQDQFGGRREIVHGSRCVGQAPGLLAGRGGAHRETTRLAGAMRSSCGAGGCRRRRSSPGGTGSPRAVRSPRRRGTGCRSRTR